MITLRITPPSRKQHRGVALETSDPLTLGANPPMRLPEFRAVQRLRPERVLARLVGDGERTPPMSDELRGEPTTATAHVSLDSTETTPGMRSANAITASASSGVSTVPERTTL